MRPTPNSSVSSRSRSSNSQSGRPPYQPYATAAGSSTGSTVRPPRVRRRRRGFSLPEKAFLFLASVLVVVTLLLFLWPPRVKSRVTVEAGTSSLNLADFIRPTDVAAATVTNMNDLNLAVPGQYDLQILIGGKLYHSQIHVVDRTPPAAAAADQEIWIGETLAASAFVRDLHDATEVRTTFVKAPDFSKSGTQDVVVRLEDASLNKTELSARLTIARVRTHVQLEAGTPAVDLAAFLGPNETEPAAFVTDLSSLDLGMPGRQTIQIQLGDEIYDSELELVDTTAPAATPVNQAVWINDTLDARTLVKDIVDVSAVTVTFKTAPDLTKAGSQAVTVLLVDEAGNQAALPVQVTVKVDKTAPVIKGVKSQTVFIGATIAYRKGVTVTDNRDEKLDLQVDSSAVNLRKTGTYTVIYTATDAAGNTARKKATILVVEKTANAIDPAVLDQMADDVLARIIKPGMSKREKANAIYWWTKRHIGYVNHSDKSSWINAAYQGIKTGRGDCFNYFATAKILLTRAGIQNMDIVKLNGGHYWNLVNLGEGWYHFDTTPRKAGGEFFMLTDAEITAYSVKHNNSHIWDHSKYPATPAE